eukprot:659179-Lingulodinium_polyedra.AAC.1
MEQLSKDWGIASMDCHTSSRSCGDGRCNAAIQSTCDTQECSGEGVGSPTNISLMAARGKVGVACFPV